MRSRSASLWLVTAALLAAPVAATSVARAEGVPVTEASKQQKKDAKAAYVEGLAHFKAGRFDEALERFRASYDIVASPNARFMVARTLASAERVAEAYPEMVATVEAAEQLGRTMRKYRKTAKAAKADLEKLRGKVGLLTVKLVGGEADIGLVGSDVQLVAGVETAVAPGEGEVIVESADGQEVRRRFVMEAGGEQLLEIEVPKPKPEPAPPVAPEPKEPVESAASSGSGSLRPYAFVAAGVGAAGFITFAVAGSMASSTFSDLEDRCPNKRCPASLEGDADKGKSQRLVANVGLGVGIVGLGVGAALWALDGGEERPAPTAGTARWIVGPGSVAVRGAF